MRFLIPIRGATLGLAFAALAVATPLLPQAERKLKDSDVKKVSKALGDYYVALEANKGILEAEADFIEQVKKVNEKKLKGGQLLGYLGDMNEVIYNCLLYTSPSPRDQRGSRMPSSA